MNGLLRTSIALFCFVPVFFASLGAPLAEAGFGITPPYVKNTSLTRNSIYEQQILMVRSDPTEAQRAEIRIDAPELEGWLEVVEGTPIDLPSGEQKVPMTVRVRVPADAEYKDYTGAIRIRTIPADDALARGSVNISLGARIDIALSVIDKKIEDFRVRKISVSELNEGTKLGWLFFPGKIRFDMMIENTGNVDIAPSRVEFRIFNRTGDVLLEEVDNIGSIEEVAPYDTETVTAEIPTRLPADSYIARYRVYNGDSVRQEGDVTLSILPAGTLQAAGFGFIGLSTAHKISVLLPILSLVIAVLYFLFMRRKQKG